ncbi:MAG: hypothetical protein H7122_09265 [Chitinophagaceae bacterium]|nr:hypothetical protein [Chitinophagaceae bacterium]
MSQFISYHFVGKDDSPAAINAIKFFAGGIIASAIIAVTLLKTPGAIVVNPKPQEKLPVYVLMISAPHFFSCENDPVYSIEPIPQKIIPYQMAFNEAFPYEKFARNARIPGMPELS